MAESTDKHLADLSHWNVISDWGKFGEHFDGFIIKATQGSNYQDPAFQDHLEHALATGKPVGAYHFLTNDNALDQANNFRNTIKDAPLTYGLSIDCEAFSTAGALTHYELYSNGHRLNVSPFEGEVFPVLEFRTGVIDDTEFYNTSYYGLEWPTVQNLDAVGRYISGYMGFEYPDVYSNPSTLKRLNCPKSMNRYGLWVAHWGVEKPTVTTPWTKWKLWQKEVIDGTPYGVEGKIDHDVWNPDNEWPFKPSAERLSVDLYINELKKHYVGDLAEVL